MKVLLLFLSQGNDLWFIDFKQLANRVGGTAPQVLLPQDQGLNQDTCISDINVYLIFI